MKYHIPTFIIAGNHDSNTRIHFGSDLFASQNLYIVGKCKKGYECITLKGEAPIHIYLIPYMEPQEVREIAQDTTIKRHDDAMRYLTGKIEKEDKEGAKVIVAHSFVAGGDLSDSERRLCAVGTAEMVGADCFKPFAYTALGHLHKPQAIGGNEAIRYSGSLLKYSVSEANQPKGMTCVIIEEGRLKQVEEVAFTPKRDLRIIEGPMAELIKVGTSLDEKQRNDYVYARITDQDAEDMVGTLRNVYPYILGAEKVSHTNQKTLESKQSEFEAKRNQSIVELFEAFIDYVSEGAFEEGEKEAIHQLIAKIEEESYEA